MMKMNLQFFAHKKGVGSTKNGRDSESKRLLFVLKEKAETKNSALYTQ